MPLTKKKFLDPRVSLVRVGGRQGQIPRSATAAAVARRVSDGVAGGALPRTS